MFLAHQEINNTITTGTSKSINPVNLYIYQKTSWIMAATSDFGNQMGPYVSSWFLAYQLTY